jgi:hypothetical protein
VDGGNAQNTRGDAVISPDERHEGNLVGTRTLSVQPPPADALKFQLHRTFDKYDESGAAIAYTLSGGRG